MTFFVQAPGFAADGRLPRDYTCDGAALSPALTWGDVPAGTQSLALIIDDPDAPDPAAPKMTFVHWVLYNLPPTTTGLAAGVQTLPPGTRVGINDGGDGAYVGACPPIGTHRYFHKLYALDTVLSFDAPPAKEGLVAAMKGHVLAETSVMGTYSLGPLK